MKPAAAAAAPRLLDDDDPAVPVVLAPDDPNDPECAGDTLLVELVAQHPVSGELDPLDEPDRLPARRWSSA